MASALDITLHALGAETSGGNGTAIDIAALRSAAELELDVTALVGDFDLYLDTSDDSASWRQVHKFETISSAPRNITTSLHGLERYVRARWTVGTSATFKLAGTAHQLFAFEKDLRSEVPHRLIEGATSENIADSLIKASCDIEAALATSPAVTLPLTSWPHSIRQRCAILAGYRVMKHRGYQPDSPDDLIRDEHKAAQLWLDKVSAGTKKPLGVAPALESTIHTHTATKRGW